MLPFFLKKDSNGDVDASLLIKFVFGWIELNEIE